MPLSFSNIKFWGTTVQWTASRSDHVPGSLGASEQEVVDSLNYLYGSKTARSTINLAIANQGDLRFAADTTGNTVVGAYIPDAQSWIAYDQASEQKLYYFNTFGTLVKDTPALSIIHEIAHSSNSSVIDPLSGDAEFNKPDFDYRGPAVTTQNKVAMELGLTDKIQASYQAGLVDGLSPSFSLFQVGHSYTSGNAVDVVRLGTSGADNQDHSMRTAASKDLFFGLGGDDIMNGGKGIDYLYGGDGNDTIHGGVGNDFLYGDGEKTDTTQSGNDKIYGDAGNDYLFGGLGSDELHGGAGINRLQGGDGADKLVAEGKGDTLNGGHGNDIIELKSSAATIEFGSGDGSDAVQFDLKAGDYTLKLTDLNPDDIEVIGGGFDAYYVKNHSDTTTYPDGEWYQFLTIRDKATGDQITFLENGLNGTFNIGPSSSALPKGYNKGFYADDQYPSSYPSNQGQLDKITFADGSSWDQKAIWDHLSVSDTWGYAQGNNVHGYGGGDHDETNFVDYVNQTYLQAFSEFHV